MPPDEMSLEHWPLPTKLRSFRDLLVADENTRWETSPLALYKDVDGEQQIVLPSKYESVHAAFILNPWTCNPGDE